MMEYIAPEITVAGGEITCLSKSVIGLSMGLERIRHIKEHYEGLANFNEAEMSPAELEFHYFKLHDFDNNTKLDGLEIYQALTHLVSHDQSEADVAAIVDTVLHEDDTNRDGYVTYTEYVLANRREDARARFEEQKKRESQREPGAGCGAGAVVCPTSQQT